MPVLISTGYSGQIRAVIPCQLILGKCTLALHGCFAPQGSSGSRVAAYSYSR
jgi:hypothetical protein